MVAKKSPKAGRSTDPPLNWFCFYLVQKKMAEGVRQWEISRVTHVPKSAITKLLKEGKGIGNPTARVLAKYFGYQDYSAFIAAVDEWWEREGLEYSQEQLTRLLHERIESERTKKRAPTEEKVEVLGEPPKRKKKRIA